MPTKKPRFTKSTQRLKDKLDMSDLLRVASKDRRVASALLKDPEVFAKSYNLSGKQLAGLKQVIDQMGPVIPDAAADIDYE